jgi:NCAIR mutase (PurE)-related protein
VLRSRVEAPPAAASYAARPMTTRQLLERLREGAISIDSVLEELAIEPLRDVGDAVVDAHRAQRQGVPEVVFGHGKTPEQIVTIARTLLEAGQNVLVTRIEPEAVAAVERANLAPLRHHPMARTLRIEPNPVAPRESVGIVAVVTAGTSDLPVADEAAETLAAVGLVTERITDVGVAGIHRLLGRLEVLRRASIVIAVAGMEGALPSVVGGIVSAPVIAVPTSIGYGTALGGLTPMLAMLTSCASGLTVVNVDNGFGAALAAHRIACALERRRGEA